MSRDRFVEETFQYFFSIDFWLWAKNYWKGGQNCTLCPEERLKEKGFWKVFKSYKSWSFFLSFSIEFSAGLSKLHSTCPGEHFGKNILRKNLQAHFFRTQRKLFNLVKIAFFLFGGTLWANVFFWKLRNWRSQIWQIPERNSGYWENDLAIRFQGLNLKVHCSS